MRRFEERLIQQSLRSQRCVLFCQMGLHLVDGLGKQSSLNAQKASRQEQGYLRQKEVAKIDRLHRNSSGSLLSQTEQRSD
jgi:hypothetical protein